MARFKIAIIFLVVGAGLVAAYLNCGGSGAGNDAANTKSACGAGTSSVNGACQLDPAIAIVTGGSSQYWIDGNVYAFQFFNTSTSITSGTGKASFPGGYCSGYVGGTVETFTWTETASNSMNLTMNSSGNFNCDPTIILTNIATNTVANPTTFSFTMTNQNGTSGTIPFTLKVGNL